MFNNAELPGSRTANKAKQDLPQCASFFAQLASGRKLHDKKENLNKNIKNKKQKTKPKTQNKKINPIPCQEKRKMQ
ncbi:hypothetical protein [Phascolarctobacterium sp.]